MIKIALDMMGGDNAPSSKIDGAVDFLNHNNGSVKLYLVGSRQYIKNHSSKFSIIESKYFKIIETSQIISPEDSPSRIFKIKPDSSMNVFLPFYL